MLDEKRIKQIVNETINKVILENYKNKKYSIINEITIKDKWDKETNRWNGKLNSQTFDYLCKLDPTTKPNKVGRYANWILAKYNPNADFDRLKICLEWYADGVKRGVANRLGISNDINAYKTYEDFINTMNGIMHSNNSSMSNSEHNNRQKLEGQFKILGSNSTFEIIACKTFAAERYFGSGTEWCTVGNEYYFERYMNEGQLYIIYPKNGNEDLKMQFHFKSDSYADKHDNVYNIPLECIENTIKDENIRVQLLLLCKKVFSKFENYFITFEEKLQNAIQCLTNSEPLKNIFDVVGKFHYGFARVSLNDKWNFITQENNFISKQWFDDVKDFQEGFAVVELDLNFNFINQKGELISRQWFDYVKDFQEGFAVIRLDEKYNFINYKCGLISNQWFDYADMFYEGFAVIRLDGKYNFINQDGKLISSQWFDYADSFYDGFAVVVLNETPYLINTNGKLCSKNKKPINNVKK